MTEEQKLNKDDIVKTIAEQYLSKGSDIEKMISEEIGLDDYSKAQLLGEYDQISRQRDPQAECEGKGQLFAQLKQRKGFSIGQQVYGPRLSDLPRDKQFQLMAQLGTQDLEEYINPGSGGRRGRY